MTYKTFLALILGALFLSVNIGCDVESPADDDDVAGDDDDTTDDFAATVSGESDEPGDFILIKDDPIASYSDTMQFSQMVDEPGNYSVGFETDNKLYVHKASQLGVNDNGVENTATFDSNDDKWGVKLNGSYDLYDLDDNYQVTYDFETYEDGTDVILMITGLASYVIVEYTYGEGNGWCTSNSDGTFVDCGNSYWLRN